MQGWNQCSIQFHLVLLIIIISFLYQQNGNTKQQYTTKNNPQQSQSHILFTTIPTLSILQEGKAELFEFTHPDPYCVPFMPGGSLFMRNPPPPLSICFPDGDIPADAPKHTLNPDMSVCKEETGKLAVGSVLVDFGKKNME